MNPHKKPDYYIYKLIETLLPKAMVDFKKSPNLKMIELYIPFIYIYMVLIAGHKMTLHGKAGSSS